VLSSLIAWSRWFLTKSIWDIGCTCHRYSNVQEMNQNTWADVYRFYCLFYISAFPACVFTYYRRGGTQSLENQRTIMKSILTSVQRARRYVDGNKDSPEGLEFTPTRQFTRPWFWKKIERYTLWMCRIIKAVLISTKNCTRERRPKNSFLPPSPFLSLSLCLGKAINVEKYKDERRNVTSVTC